MREARRDPRPRRRPRADVAGAYIAMTPRFVRTLVAVAPFIRSVSIAGLARQRRISRLGRRRPQPDRRRRPPPPRLRRGQRRSGLLHALRAPRQAGRRPHAPADRAAPDDREPDPRALAVPPARSARTRTWPSSCWSPSRSSALDVIDEVVDANPALLEHFPQLADKAAPLRSIRRRGGCRSWLYPGISRRRRASARRARRGATCSGRAGTSRMRSRASRSCARRCGPTRLFDERA